MSNVASNNPKATVTALATGLESLSFLVKDITVQRICVIVAPAIALVLTIVYRIIKKDINLKKGVREYKNIIFDMENECKNPSITKERKLLLQKEIEKCRDKINDLRVQNIESLI